MAGRQGHFHRFLVAGGLTNLGDGVATLAWTWLATQLTRDPFLISLMPVALRLPWFLFAIPAGLVTDRVSRKKLLLAMDVARGLAFALAAAAIWQALPLADPPEDGVAEVGLFVTLALCAAAIGLAEVFRDTAAQTVLPSLVDPDRLESANARFSAVEILGNTLLGPAVGAFLIAAALPLPFLLNAAAYLSATVLVAGVGIRQRRPAGTRRHWRHEFTEAAGFLIQQPTLRLLALFTGVFNGLHQMVVVGLVLFAQEVLGLGAGAYGLVLSAGASGGLVAGLVAAPLIARVGGARLAQLSSAVIALAFLAVPLAGGGVGVAACLMVFSFLGLLWDTVSISYRQRAVPDEMRGRVNALYRMASWGMMPVGLMVSGLVVDLGERIMPREVALTLPFLVAGGGVAVMTLLAWRGIGRGFGRPPGVPSA
ncbi:enterobactin exporter EntS [Pseudooceanicola marinus]|uniref:Enterobactin exporter EntS n=1 Tax=Pseudooceanicola marinus TaxID=396013 RepID=A0A1X7A823_9RHOB|nr:MFS transporter [Pseudooceanicola marinus]PJE33590.1 MFS transporter [Pseudooceanicola marinus]SLN72950.1 enterobactin exporter EntS [Pseudooceanicola marinus]